MSQKTYAEGPAQKNARPFLEDTGCWKSVQWSFINSPLLLPSQGSPVLKLCVLILCNLVNQLWKVAQSSWHFWGFVFFIFPNFFFLFFFCQNYPVSSDKYPGKIAYCSSLYLFVFLATEFVPETLTWEWKTYKLSQTKTSLLWFFTA